MGGRCPCCNAHLRVDGGKRFGIMACPECDRIIWWLLPSEEGAAPFLSADLKHRLIEDLGADSLDTVELVMALEEELGMEIPDEDAEKLKSVEDVLEYIERHRKK